MILSRLFSGSKNKEKKYCREHDYTQVWTSGFNAGFSKAWDMQKPLIEDGFNKIKEDLITNAKMETLKGLQPALRGKHGTDTK